MNIQIYGSKKDFDTKKAERYFKERNIKFQSIDLHHFGFSKGEFCHVVAALGVSSLINSKTKEYQSLYIKYIVESKVEQTLFENPKLFKTPIVRNGRLFTVGYQPKTWDNWKSD